MARLQGKVALVTGGGSGIGRAVARACGREGAKVVVVGRREEAVAETVAIIRREGAEADALRADVSVRTDTEMVVSRISDRDGRLDIACNCAGTVNCAPFLQESD